MTTTKTFHIGDVLSITTGKLVSLEHIGGVYKILNHMTGDNLMTHQLPRASDECEDNLRAQHPRLAEIEVPEIDGEATLITFLASLYAEYGEWLEVEALPEEQHTKVDPIQEFKMMRPDAPVIVVQAK